MLTAIYGTNCGYDADNQLRALISKIVCIEAFRNAIPFLDLVLTPYGFGIVSNTNVVPASKERVNEFRSEVLSGAISAPHRAVIASLQSVEIVMLKAAIEREHSQTRLNSAEREQARPMGKSLLSTSTCSIEHDMLANIVDVVRKDPINYKEWHNSSLKQLFSPPIFVKKKKDTAY